MLNFLIKMSALFLFAFCLTSCYRMPTEEDYCLIPSTNNASLTHENPSAIPGVGY